jgi:hypothetical protein
MHPPNQVFVKKLITFINSEIKIEISPDFAYNFKCLFKRIGRIQVSFYRSFLKLASVCFRL